MTHSSIHTQPLPLQLLAPAGGQEQLEAAIHFGADEVYLSGERWSMRARAANFADADLAAAVAYAHEHNTKVDVTINTLMYDQDIAELPAYLEYLDSLGVDALIVGDLGVFSLAQRHAPHARLHVSTQASVANSEAALAYVRMGAKRIVLAREMNLEQIAAMHRRVGNACELEAFVHGAMCVAVSGRCLLSSAMVGPERSASCGNCTQPCRWTWKLVEETRPDAPLSLEEDERGSYILSANDLCMIEHLDALVEAGISVVKIEGRNKGAYYVGAATNAYRQVIDGGDPKLWLGELEATSHRPYSTGFFFNEPTQNPGRVEYEQSRTLVAVASSSVPAEQSVIASEDASAIASEDASAIASEDSSASQKPAETGAQAWLSEVVCRNKIAEGEHVIVLAPHEQARHFTLSAIEHLNPTTLEWEQVSEMRANMERYRFLTPFELSAGDMLCKE